MRVYCCLRTVYSLQTFGQSGLAGSQNEYCDHVLLQVVAAFMVLGKCSVPGVRLEEGCNQGGAPVGRTCFVVPVVGKIVEGQWTGLFCVQLDALLHV